MTEWFNTFLTDDDINKIQNGKAVKRYIGGYIVYIQKEKIEEVK